MNAPTPQTSLALIQQDITYMKGGIDEMKNTLKEINARFATKEEVEKKIQAIEVSYAEKIADLKNKIAFLEKGVWAAIAFVLYQLGAVAFKLLVK